MKKAQSTRNGKPHIDYYRKKQLCEDVFAEFNTFQRGGFSKLSYKYDVPKSTIRGWYDHWKEDPNWRPYNGKVHGLHHRIFTDEEEKGLRDFIEENYIKPGHLFQNQTFKQLASNAYLQKHFFDEDLKNVQFSNSFVNGFKKRNRFSTRRAHYKRRPSNIGNEKIDNWLKKVKEIADTIPHDRILNADETAVRILPSNLTTWAEKGSDSVSIIVNDCEKTMITAMATVSMAGTKLPLFLIAKGKTELVEKTQLGDISYHMSGHSDDGWMDQECFKNYLKWIRQQYFDEDLLYLILDSFSVHTTQESKQMAEALKIKLMFLPPGMTDKFQPLDREIFGCLKAYTKKEISKIIFEKPEERIGMKTAVQMFIWAWEHLNCDTIIEAWSIYEN